MPIGIVPDPVNNPAEYDRWKQDNNVGAEWANKPFSEIFSGVGDWWKGSMLNPDTWLSRIGSKLGFSQDNNSANVQFTEKGTAYDVNSADSYIDALNTDVENERNAALQEQRNHREDTAYARMFEQLQGLGINPALFLSSGSPVGSAQSYNSASSKASNSSQNARTDQANNAKIMAALIAALALVLK